MHHRSKAVVASLEAQGFTGEGGASSELGHRGRNGDLASQVAQGFSREEAPSKKRMSSSRRRNK